MALDQITHALVSDFLAEAGMTSTGPEKDFERFVAQVVLSPHIEGVIDYENVLAGDGGDTGLDVIAIVINGELATDVDAVDALAEDNRTLDVQFIFAQAKSSASFETTAIGQVAYGARDFFADEPTLARNAVVAAAAEVSDRVFANARLFRNENPTCTIYYATVGRWTDDGDLSARCRAAENDLDALNIFSRASFVPLDARNVR